MAFGADIYREAAFERLNAAFLLHSAGRHVDAHYLAGVAVECMLRAYHGHTGLPFDERHDLKELAKSSGFESSIPPRLYKGYSFAMETVIARWRNNHRYRSLPSLRTFLKDSKLDRGIKGDFVKESGRAILSAAMWLINSGGAP